MLSLVHKLRLLIDEYNSGISRLISLLQEFKRNLENQIDHDCHRDKYGQDACPVCDGEELEIPIEFEEEPEKPDEEELFEDEEELVPAEESLNEHDLTRKEIEEEESKRGWA